jgi:hypothetical protein
MHGQFGPFLCSQSNISQLHRQLSEDKQCCFGLFLCPPDSSFSPLFRPFHADAALINSYEMLKFQYDYGKSALVGLLQVHMMMLKLVIIRVLVTAGGSASPRLSWLQRQAC